MNVEKKFFSACCRQVFSDFCGDDWPELRLVGTAPSGEEKALIQFAIELAVGKSGAEKDLTTPLRPVLQLVGQPDEVKRPRFIRPAKLSLGEEEFPFPKPEVSPHQEEDAKNHLKECLEKLAQIEGEIHHESALSFFQVYLTTLPCGYAHLPDVSLYDHLKSVIAYADCLQRYLEAEGKSLEELKDDPEGQPFRMIGADISGIQKFIYDIVSKNAAKNLKGRSFYLDLLVDSVIQILLKEFSLSTAHIIYASGGGFYLLAPNVKDFEKKLTKLRKDLQDGIFREHGTKLFLALGSISVTVTQLFMSTSNEEEDAISGIWSGLIEKLNTQKKQRFSHKLIEDFELFFTEHEIGGRATRDVITDEEFTEEEEEEATRILKRSNPDRLGKKVSFLEAAKNDENGTITFSGPVKNLTYQQILLGRELRETDYWVSSFGPLELQSSRRRKNNRVLGFLPIELGNSSEEQKDTHLHPDLHVYHYFLTSEELEINKERILAGTRLLQVNKPDVEDRLKSLPAIHTGFTFYGGNEFPMGEGKKADFPLETEELIGERDFKRIGLLRMDVDNLGQLFINGFEGGARTFSRYSALSRSLDYFFKGYLNTILKPYVEKATGDDLERESAYILYAGGDDLFILGHWINIMEIAHKIRRKFGELAAKNPKVSLSGGIAILTPKFPIMLGAAYSADAEKKAKEHSYAFNPSSTREKDAFTFLEYPLNWDKEFTVVKYLKEALLDYISPERQETSVLLSDNILSRILRHAKTQKLQRDRNITEKWYWNLMYDLSQIQRRVKEPDKNAPREEKNRYKRMMVFLDDLKVKAVKNEYKALPERNGYSYLELMSLGARWANMEIRTMKRK